MANGDEGRKEERRPVEGQRTDWVEQLPAEPGDEAVGQSGAGAPPGQERIRRADLRGSWALAQEAELRSSVAEEQRALAQRYGLEAAPSISDRSLTLFRREPWTLGRGVTFLQVPFLEDMRQLGGQDVVIVGAPLDSGTTYRGGTRFGPEAIRRLSSLSYGYNPERGRDLREELTIVDAGDIQVIPANIEKSFDQITQALRYISERAVFPVVLGGDHSIGYATVRGVAPVIEGKLGIIHFDRHSDLSERTYDERMHASPFFHATTLPNVPPANLVQIGIGGWTGSKKGMRVARERQASVLTIDDIEHYGIERVMEYALEVAWRGASAVWLSFDIDVVDPAFAPGTGTPEPGGLLPREVFKMVRLAAREGLRGMEVVEVSPPYDVAELTALLAGRIVLEVLAALVEHGRLGRRAKRP